MGRRRGRVFAQEEENVNIERYNDDTETTETLSTIKALISPVTLTETNELGAVITIKDAFAAIVDPSVDVKLNDEFVQIDKDNKRLRVIDVKTKHITKRVLLKYESTIA